MTRGNPTKAGKNSLAAAGVAGRVIATLFGLIFTAGGFFFLWVGSIQPHLESSRADHWTPTEATIVESGVTGEGRSLENVIRFRYRYGGETFESEEPHLNPPGLSYSEVQRLRDSLPKGKKVTAYVDPSDPRKAVLFRNGSGSVLVGLFALPFILIGLTVAGFSLFGKTRKKRLAGFSKTSAPGALGGRKLVLCLFGIPFFAMGAGFCWIAGVSPLLESQAAQGWPQVPCTINESFVESHSSSDGTTYSVEIRFTYEWDGKTYHGENYTFGDISSSGKASKEAIVRRYPKGSTSTCFVNPEDPYEAVITTDVGMMPYGIIAFSSIFMAVGAGLFIAGLRRKTTPGVNAALARIPEPADTEILELAPVTSRLTRTLFSVIIALFWNGVSSIPLILFFKEGGSETLLLIIGLVFGGIGLFLIANAIRSLLVLRNPLPKVMVAPGRVRPCTRILLSWRLKGSASRLENLAIYLEGLEIAQYRRGTRTVTDQNVFRQECLFESADRGSFRQGTIEYDFPEASVPSMKSEHNEILWQLVFSGDISRWPDLNETFRLPVLPAIPADRPPT